MACALLAGALLCGWAAPAKAAPSVTIAVLPQDTTVAELAAAGLSPGLMSAGIGEVSAEETYEDISAGNREPSPSDAVPGLLESTLASAGLSGSLRRIAAGEGDLSRLAAGVGEGDVLIAFAGPPPAPDHALPIGTAGSGFDGNLTSDSTRTDGYVISTDIAPTVLRRLGLPVPDEMDGEPIRTEGAIDPDAVEDLGARMAAIPERRGPVVILCLLAWILSAAAVGLWRPGSRRAAAAWGALAFAYMPLLLLAGAAIETGAVAEGLLIGLGAAALAAATLKVLPGWRALAIACAITVVAYAIDVVAGSGLTRLSLLGPNPTYGARFYGIGNELEALFAVMVPVGVGAGLSAYTGWGRGVARGRAAGEGRATGRGRRMTYRAATTAFLGAAVAGGVVFGAGRFGADVGAPITLAVGAAVAAMVLPGRGFVDFPGSPPENSTKFARARLLAAVIAAPFIALVLLALIDLASAANAHLTRSVLDAGGADDLADTAERRLRLSAHDFSQAAGNPLFWTLVAGLAVAIANWRRIDAWLRPAPLARAGVLGACAAVAVGVLVNDSGATFLVLGTCALAASLAYAWSQA